MSMERVEKIKCRKCGKESDFAVWQSVNTQLDPELKEKILNRELFEFKCPYCGDTARVDYHFLYHQMEDSLMIYYTDEVDECEKQIAMLYNTDGKMGSIMKQAAADYLIRIVTSQNQLCEKIRIFDAGLDDRIVEIIKVIFMYQIQNQRPDLEVEEAFYFTDEDGKHMIDFIADGRVIARTAMSAEMYQNMLDEFQDSMPDIRKDAHVINVAWALQKMGAEPEEE